jgi:hypothetical protein
LPGKITGPQGNKSKGREKLGVKVCNAFNEMIHQRPKTFFYHYIFLSALMAEAALHKGSAIQAVFFGTFRLVRHAKFFLKIGTKKRWSLRK